MSLLHSVRLWAEPLLSEHWLVIPEPQSEAERKAGCGQIPRPLAKALAVFKGHRRQSASQFTGLLLSASLHGGLSTTMHLRVQSLLLANCKCERLRELTVFRGLLSQGSFL